MRLFVHNDIILLTGRAPRSDLAESVGPDLRLGALLQPDTAAERRRIGWAIVRPNALRERLVLGKFNTPIANSAIGEMLGCASSARPTRSSAAAENISAKVLRAQTAWVARNPALVGWMRARSVACACGWISSTRPPSSNFMRHSPPSISGSVMAHGSADSRECSVSAFPNLSSRLARWAQPCNRRSGNRLISVNQQEKRPR
jgi:hypothetical protein